MKEPNTGSISIQAFRRLPMYYTYLKVQQKQGVVNISSPTIAKDLQLNEVQVRKDLAAVSAEGGKPRTGFDIGDLLCDIGTFLGYNNIDDAILVGVGQLGKSLLSYGGFEENGVRIVAGFDSDPTLCGKAVGGKGVFSMEKLPSLVGRMSIHIGIITVPGPAAQAVCDILVQNGILAVWNFAPVHLSVPEHVLVQNENMAVSLALLSQHLADRIETN
ncbi:redox-sensing transcriptional repressor Rex [Clostridia bacterium OttesenSCG-928-O13]|nr:redox-sensing transcriptional repressor Rex [Clostridia bacterium OttesenSCG-928-O13]